MTRIQHARNVAFGIAVVLAGSLITPMAGSADEPTRAVAPNFPSWDETSGYGSVEASRAEAASLLVSDVSWDAMSGYGSVERSRANRREMRGPSSHASLTFRETNWSPVSVRATDLLSGQMTGEQAAAHDWDQMSGYGSVEASRGAAAALVAKNPT